MSCHNELSVLVLLEQTPKPIPDSVVSSGLVFDEGSLGSLILRSEVVFEGGGSSSIPQSESLEETHVNLANIWDVVPGVVDVSAPVISIEWLSASEANQY